MELETVDVIVLNWRTPEMSADCGRLAAAALPGARVYLVDNGSGDGSAQRMREAMPEAVIVENEQNLGFGGGFNTGIKAGQRPFLLILNSDARPVGDGYRQLLEHCASDARIGAVTPQTVDRQGRLVPQMAAEPPPWHLVLGCLPLTWRLIGTNVYRPVAGPPQIINWLPGLCVTAFRREALEAIGAFDPGYFLGWEEWDLTRRLRAAGWQIAIHPGAEVMHEGHGSTPTNLQSWRNKHGRQSICHHLSKYYGRRWSTLGRIGSGLTDLYADLRNGR
jgi:GT2 family glycosyltransferase